MQHENELLTYKEVQDKLKVSRGTVVNLVKEEKLRVVKISKRSIRFNSTDVENYIQTNN